MLPEIAEKFQEVLDDWLTGVKELAQVILGDDADEETVFLQSEYCHVTTLINFSGAYYYPDNTSSDWGKSVFCKCDFNFSDGVSTISSPQYVGRGYNNGNYPSDEEVQLMMGAVNGAMPVVNTAAGYSQACLVGDSVGNYVRITGYNGAYNNDAVSLTYGNNAAAHRTQTMIAMVVYVGGVEFTVDNNQIITTTGVSEIECDPTSQPIGLIVGIKGYPYVGNMKNITYINDFVNKMISTGQSTHNYNNTYTTPSGAVIRIYYGDNYTFTYVEDDEPVSYDDIKNAIDIAINQINEDNDTDIHTEPWSPEPPEPEPLESDNQEDGGNYNHAEFTKVYACTSEELNNLYQWMGGGAAGTSGTSPVTVPDSFDPMNRIVGLIGYPMIIDVGVGDATTFTFRNAANQTINTGWSTYKYGNFDREFDLGTVEIPNWEEVNNGAPFLDYAATVEIYIPFCGIVGLDPQSVMGCTLSCKMWIDFVTGDCSAVVYTNYGGEDAQHPVAFVSGNCGSAEVVSANAFGAYQGAKAQASHKMSQAILGGVKNLATSIIGGATTGFTRGAANPSGTGGNAGMKAGAIGSVIGGAMDLGVNLTLQNLDNQYAVQVAKNALGTTISGSFGQQTSWYYMDTPYIKVTWPTPISKDVELYGKTFGVPVHRSGLLNEFTGYTVCNNVDVSGIVGATASELAMIKQFLETGVFIKEGGEE